MADREPKAWITVNGAHVPIFEGETKADAAKRAADRQKGAGKKSASPAKGKASTSKKERAEEGSRSRVYNEQLKDVQEDIKQFESTPKSLRSADYDKKLQSLKRRSRILKIGLLRKRILQQTKT